jgi:topoisomerase-4 subunit A
MILRPQSSFKDTKLYVNREEGFLGTSLKKETGRYSCSDIDDVIVFLRDGNMMVTKVDTKTLWEKILHCYFDKKVINAPFIM